MRITRIYFEFIQIYAINLAQDAPKCSTPGESVPAGDGCNTCTCMEDGTLGMCTIESCVEEPKPTEGILWLKEHKFL